MKQDIISIFKNIALLLIILVIADRGLGIVIEHYLFTEKQGDSFVTRRALTEMEEEIVIIGSSRAQHHYVPALITKGTGLSCYNIGRDGMKMLYYEAVFKAMISYHKPKIIILDLTFNDFEYDAEEQQFMTAAVLPFLNKNKALSKQIYDESRAEYYKAKISVLYRLNSLPVSILQHHVGFGNEAFNGYEPLKGSDPEILKTSLWENKGYKESGHKLKAFENIVKISKAKNIKLFVVVSPALQMPKINSIRSADIILARYGLKSYSYAKLFSIKHKDFFHDPGHLNSFGAEAFTSKFIADQL